MFSVRSGKGEPVVLVHGLGSCHEIWDEMLPQLQPGHELLAVDLPGFGQSPPLPEPSLEGLADAIESEMDAAGWKRAHLVGHSMGGWMVLELASRGRALRTVAITPVGGSADDELKVGRRNVTADRKGALFADKLPDAVLRAIFATGPVRKLAVRQQMTRGQDASPDRLFRATRTMAAARSFDEMNAAINGGGGLIESNAERFGRIDTPVLIVTGAEDRIVLPAGGPRLRDAIPGAELLELPGVGHAPVLDRPEEIGRIAAEFLRG